MSNYRIPTISKKQWELLWGPSESRKPIKRSVKTKVYKRAKGCCESCGEKTPESLGQYHHHRKPYISPTEKTVQFLCLKCHKKYGHKRKVVIVRDLIYGDKKKTVTMRYKVKKHPKKKKKTKKKIKRKKSKTKKKTTKKKTTKRKKRRKSSTNPYGIKIPSYKPPQFKF